jgi:hypothetical protein
MAGAEILKIVCCRKYSGILASPSAQQLSDDINPMATSTPVALCIRLCLLVGPTPGGMP